MLKIDVSTTLAAAVDEFPQLAREFEQRGLDYCCGGQRTLGEACEQIGLDPVATVAELAATEASSAAGEWATMAADALVDHLEATHHRYLWDELPRVTTLVDKIVGVHGERHPELADIAACFAQTRADLEPHMLKEERVLFPMIRELARLRQLTSGYVPPADGCASYVATFVALEQLEADTHLHIHKENNVLFPLVIRLETEVGVI